MEIGEQLGKAGRCNRLVLTSRSEESIVIGGNTVVTILRVEGEKEKLGIEAPARSLLYAGNGSKSFNNGSGRRRTAVRWRIHMPFTFYAISSSKNPQNRNRPRLRIERAIFRRSLPARWLSARLPDPRYCVFSQVSRSVDKVSAATR